MKVGAISTRSVVTITQDESILSAARRMREKNVGDVVVVAQTDGGTIPIGIITDRDITVGVVAQGIKDPTKIFVKDIMGRELVTADADDDVAEVMHQMRMKGVRRVPVLNRLGSLVGIVAYDDILKHLADQTAEFCRLLGRQRDLERVRRVS